MNSTVTAPSSETREAIMSGSAEHRYLQSDVATTGLSIVYEPEDLEPILDIIFVHGLQGHPFNTWATQVGHQTGRQQKPGFQHTGEALNEDRSPTLLERLRALVGWPKREQVSSYVFWPGDLLPIEFPRARIMVFGYDTIIAKHQFAGAVNRNSIFAHSSDLVNELSRARPLGRPVEFVTHSLGGIVTKEVVPDVSSRLGDSRERAETLDGDHRSMCRYRGMRDSNYKKVVAELRMVYTKLTSESLPLAVDYPHWARLALDKDMIDHLKFPEMFFRQHEIGIPADNTCQWLSNTPNFATWIQRSNVSNHLGILQIIGKPGSGKSTLMKKAFEVTRARFRGSEGTYVIGHFLDRGGKPLQYSAKGMFQSLLYQIGILHPTWFAAFREHEQGDLQRLESSKPTSYLHVLKAIFRSIFSNSLLAPKRTIIFIDGLDECGRLDAVQMGYYLEHIARLAHANRVQLDICVSRREYPSITIPDSLEIHMEAHNNIDIAHYIHRKLEPATVNLERGNLVRELISQKSNGIFLWVSLVVEGVLENIEQGQNTNYILSRIQSLPQLLEALFHQIISDIDAENREIALRIFQWAVLATNRLRIREWHHILAFIREKPPTSLTEWKDSDYYTQTDSQLERRIRYLSKGLIEVKSTIGTMPIASESGSLIASAGSLDSTMGDSRVVQPIHETVAEFFNSGGASSLFPHISKYDFVGQGHLAITSACLTYINIQELDRLVAARRRNRIMDQAANEVPAQDNLDISTTLLSTQTPTTCDYPQNSENKPNKIKRRRLRRRNSATSFMSSASSHSAPGHPRYQDDEDNASQMTHVDDIPRVDNASQTGKEPVSAAEIALRTLLLDDQIRRDQREARLDDGESGKFSGFAGSFESQTLEEYPALTSYALNRVFEHARASLVQKEDLEEVLRKLIDAKCWERWYFLQETLTGLHTWQDVLESQGLASWIPVALNSDWYQPDSGI
ncbi:hypothetical protein O1611_g1480 [Lasiodiplodia mahajangana]|uniref:Uncharacterized protein n=1 Tax=Lasiodiplodia mahajangana TaxID=1108764 RepID=A0ACC2JXX7_9PEZI|nr:hypothetical protein O1611_g1480 [Lasiodiplodia mahajangana]